MTINQLLLARRPDGTYLFVIGYHEMKFSCGRTFKFGTFTQREWLRAWHGYRPTRFSA